MTEKESRSGQAADLRKQAEKIVREKTIQMSESMETPSPDEASKTLHDLRVHQIELEIQNEKLRQAQTETAPAKCSCV